MAVSTRVKEVNTGSAASSTALISSKKFDFGSPDIQKRFRKITMLYKASSDVTVTVFLDGDAFASADVYHYISNQIVLSLLFQEYLAV